MKRRLFITSSSAAFAAAWTGCGGGGGGGAADLAAVTGPDTTTMPKPPVSPAVGAPFNVGTNVHTGGTTAAENTRIASILQACNFKRVRMDYFAATDQTMPRDLIEKIKAFGGSVEMSLQISYQWDNTVHTNLAAVQADAYQQTYAAVDAMKDLVHDYELLNEVQHRPEITRAVAWNSAGTSKTPFQNKPALASLAAILRGMADAIHDLAASSGLPLRVIMGVVGRDFGFLSYRRDDERVQWDVTGFHVYPREADDSLRTDDWYGEGGPLTRLGSFGKPVTINEFHAGEIPETGLRKRSRPACHGEGLQVQRQHMLELRSQTECVLESVLFYELQDSSSEHAPENRFGLMFNLDRPKVSLFLAAALAGGALSPAQRSEITSRGLLTTALIDAMQR